MPFIGRERELEILSSAMTSAQQRNVLVLGRRRIGKSELLKQAITANPQARSLYYECRQTSEADNLDSLATLASETLGFPPLALRNFREFLEFLFTQATTQPLTLILDEYPYLRETITGLDSIIQTSIDSHRTNSGLTIVLCGSYVEVMRSLLEAANPLFGRIDATIDLGPMDYYEAAQFYPSFSPEDRVRLFSAFGGVPYYNHLIDPALSVRENLINLITAPGARFEHEVPMHLGSELGKITNANEVFSALAAGYSRWRDVLAQSHVSSGQAMSQVLDKLTSMGLVERRAPINEPNNKRKTGYVISDPMALFYYRYVFKHGSARQLLDPEVFYERFVERDFEEQHVPHMFEEVCRQYLIRQNRAGRIDPPFDAIGRYWYDIPHQHASGEFDVVTHDPNGYAFYEAKFRSTPVSDAMIREEIEQVQATSLNAHTYGFFSRSGFTADPASNVRLISLEEMYAPTT